MTLWDERYYDEKFGLETPASFKYFCQWLKQQYPRSIKALCKEVNSHKKSQGKSQTKIDTFYKYSQKWKWSKRAEAYDEYLKDLHFKTKEKDVMEWETEQLKISKQRINVHTDTLQKIHDAKTENTYNSDGDLIEKGFPLQKKAYAESENQRAYNKSLDSVYTLLYGGVIKTENTNRTDMTVDADVKQDITENKTIEELNEENKQYFKELYSELENETKNVEQ